MTADDQTGWETPPPLFPVLPVTLGDYTLTHLLGCNGYSDIYVARQSHVERRVALEVLRPADEQSNGEQSAQFLNHARARVSARLPHTAHVLESGTSPEGYCYISQDLPQGHTLSSMAAQGYTLTVPQACALILAVGELCQTCAAAGLAAGPLRADMIFLNRAGEFRMLSPVLSGEPAEHETFLQTQGLANAIACVQPHNVPGQTRLSTLLSWMAEGYEGQALDWAALCETAGIIAEQLKPEVTLHVARPEAYDKGKIERAGKRRREGDRRRHILLALAALTVLGMGACGVLLAPDSAEPLPPLRGNLAWCKVGGKVVTTGARPVSIAEYRSFMETYATLDPGRQGSITTNIPPAETALAPADWEAMLAAAEERKDWNGRRLSPDSPVTNVSYWQALMYTRYLRGNLPAATLALAVRAEAGQPGIEEWTADTRPADELYAKSYIVLPADANSSPIPENNPAARHPQRGFRICP